jgi:hypothetical protein
VDIRFFREVLPSQPTPDVKGARGERVATVLARGCYWDTTASVSIVPLFILYYSSIIPLVLEVFPASAPFDFAPYIPLAPAGIWAAPRPLYRAPAWI